MASRTLTTLQGAVRNRVPISSTDTALTAAVLTDFINAALLQISVEHNWPWLLASADISIVAGTSGYAVPTGYVATDEIVELATGEGLSHRGRKDLLSIPTTNRGRPEWYSVYSALVNVRPVPDASYTYKHFYYKTEPALVSGSDTPLIPTGFDEGVVEYATYLALRFKREEARAQFAMKSYTDWLKRSSDNVIESREPRPISVRRGSVL